MSRAAVAAPFAPTDLGANLLGYFDAEVLSSMTFNGSKVITWTDPVTGFAPTQGTDTNRPVYSATSFNSRPGLTFPGDPTQLAGTSAPYPTGTTAMEIWALVKQDALVADTTQRMVVYGGGTGGATPGYLSRVVTSGVNRANGGRASTVANTGVDFSGIHVLRLQLTGATSQIDVDGNAGTPGADTTGPTGAPFRIGAYINNALTWNGVINYIGFFNLLSAGNAALLQAYLKTRGGIA